MKRSTGKYHILIVALFAFLLIAFLVRVPRPVIKELYFQTTTSPPHAFTDSDIKTVVNQWINNKTSTQAKYGDISDWDVSKVTNMTDLFKDKKHLMMILADGTFRR